MALARVAVEGQELVVEAGWRGPKRLPLSAVAGAVAEPDAKELRPEGLLVSLWARLLFWWAPRARAGDFADMTGPVVRIDLVLGTSRFPYLLVSVPDPEATVAEIRAALGPRERARKDVPWWERTPASNLDPDAAT